MKTLLMVLIITQLTGCNVFGGVMAHPLSLDRPEYTGRNPLGFIRVETKNGHWFAQHTFSLPDTEEGYGLNTIGWQAQIW